MSKYVIEGDYGMYSSNFTQTFADGREPVEMLQIMLTKGGAPYVRIYRHCDSGEAVVATVAGCCMRTEATRRALDVMWHYDALLMICEGAIKNPSKDLVRNITKR